MRRAWWLLLALSLCVAFLFQGTRGLYETTEGRYAEVAREMVAGGNWLVPHLDGHPHWTKPPLTYWSIGAGLIALGRNAWGVRLFEAIALVAATFSLGVLGAAMWDELTGWLAALIFVTTPFAVMGANAVSPDLLLACWEVMAVCCLWLALRRREHSGRWVTGMWTAFGFAFFTKGPPGLLPLAAILVYAFVQRRRGRTLPRLANPVGLLLFVLIGFGWYLVCVAREPSLLGYFLGSEVWGRVATDMHHRNARWYMPVVIFGLPLLVGLGAWLVTGIMDVRVCSRPGGFRATVRDAWHNHVTQFLLLWFFVPLVIFCMAKSRLPLYVLPLVPAQALVLARLAVRALGRDRAVRRCWRIAVVSAVVLVGAKVVAARVSSPKNMLPLSRQIRALGADHVTVIDNDKLYGLEFYLDGALHHTTSSELSTELTATGERLAAHTTHSEIYIAGKYAPALLARRCRDGSFRCRVEANPHFQLWVLQANTE
ncbi:MAG TPA: glycosyltransferase family 39 protein [Candidatus Krumholzibacteria bacterium]|nr:glycosyltransferase family 39 protein [Candidatus Krumholzibacteria bacterium]